MQLVVTAAGSIKETDVLYGAVFPAVEHLLIGDGTPHTNVQAATGMAHQVMALAVTHVVRLSPQVIQFHAKIPADVEMRITELGLKLADGTLYAYAPFTSNMASSFFKPIGYAFSISVSVARQTMPPITVNYEPLDTETISASIAAQTLSQITDYEARIDGAETLASNANAAALSAASLVSGLQIVVDDSNQLVIGLDSRVSKLEHPVVVTTTYDTQGRVDTVTETLPTGSRVTTAGYDASGRVATLVIVFDGVTRTETYTYNTSGQLTSMSASEV